MPIVAAITTAIAYFTVKAEVAKNTADEFSKALGNIGDVFQFDPVLGRVRRFADLTRNQLQGLLNSTIRTRSQLDAEFKALAESVRGLDADALRTQPLSDLAERFGGRNQGLQGQIGNLRQLRLRYEILSKQIAVYEGRLRELSKANTNATQTTSTLRVELAEIGNLLSASSREFQRTLQGTDTSAIRRAAASEIQALRTQAAQSYRVFAETEADKNALRARAIEIATRTAEREASIQERANARINKINEDAAKERFDTVNRYLNFEKAARDARGRCLQRTGT